VIVVDTNVIAATVLASEWSALAELLLSREAEWAAPVLWRSEFRNILATQIRTGRFELSAALGKSETVENMMAGREFSVDSASVLRLAVASRCTAYDCEFVALARHLGTPLVTLDRQVLAAFPSVAVELGAFARGEA